MSERTEHGIRVGAIEVSALVDLAQGSAVRIEVDATRPPRRGWVDVEASPKGQKVVYVMAPNEHTDAAWQEMVILLPDGSRVRIDGSDFCWVTVHDSVGKLRGVLNTEIES